jgi:hypothetical protein
MNFLSSGVTATPRTGSSGWVSGRTTIAAQEKIYEQYGILLDGQWFFRRRTQ